MSTTAHLAVEGGTVPTFNSRNTQRGPQKRYPSPEFLQDPRHLHDEFRRALEQIYALQDQVKTVQGKLDEAHRKLATHDGQLSASNSKVNGLYVKAVPPADGQTLKYVAKTGQIEWS